MGLVQSEYLKSQSHRVSILNLCMVWALLSFQLDRKLPCVMDLMYYCLLSSNSASGIVLNYKSNAGSLKISPEIQVSPSHSVLLYFIVW